MELKENIETLEYSIKEILNIARLLGDTVEREEESEYIIMGMNTIQKMLKSLCEKEIAKLKSSV